MFLRLFRHRKHEQSHGTISFIKSRGGVHPRVPFKISFPYFAILPLYPTVLGVIAHFRWELYVRIYRRHLAVNTNLVQALLLRANIDHEVLVTAFEHGRSIVIREISDLADRIETSALSLPLSLIGILIRRIPLA